MFPYIKMYALTCCGECYGADVYIVDEREIQDNHGILGCCAASTITERSRVLELSKKEYEMMQRKEAKKQERKKRKNTKLMEEEKAKKEKQKADKEEQKKKKKEKRDSYNNRDKFTADI